MVAASPARRRSLVRATARSMLSRASRGGHDRRHPPRQPHPSTPTPRSLRSFQHGPDCSL